MNTRGASDTQPVTSDRAEILQALRERPRARVLVVGGGINGIGIFRELALQGIDVVLAERGDFSGAASAASSHMIHGGVRYLEYGEVRLVREAVTERNRLLRLAPHYVHPQRTTIPVFKRLAGITREPVRVITGKPGKPTERGTAVIKAGLLMYDSLTRRTAKLPRHEFVGRQASLRAQPQLNPDILYTATYYDAVVASPERLAIELLLDAEGLGPHARAVNYCGLVGTGDHGVRLRDELTGDEIDLAVEVVVNATGNGVDATNALLGLSTSYMGGTKGSHIVLDHPELLAACAGREMFFENHDGRIVLVLPIGDRVLVGTSDIPIAPGEHPVCTEEEVDYFLDLVRVVFPRIQVDRRQIVYRFSGVRPLPRAEGLDPSAISRDHKIYVGELPAPRHVAAISVVGGKWTTFRALSEQVADTVLPLLGSARVAQSRALPIGGGRGYPVGAADRRAWVAATSARTGVPAGRVEELFDRYGTRAAAVAGYLGQGEDGPVPGLAGHSRRELEFLARTEHVVHLADLLMRRASWAFRGVLDDESIAAASRVVGEALGWSETRVRDEARRAAAELTSAVDPAPRQAAAPTPVAV